MPSLGSLLRPGFWHYAYRRFRRYCADLVDDYQRARTAADTLAYRADVFISDYRYLKRHPTSVIAPGVRILTPAGPCAEGAGLFLGRSTLLGRRTEVELDRETVARVGDYTRVNPDCRIFGDVSIGKYCLLAPGIFISSGDHHARLRPSWLIMDQDAAAVDAGAGRVASAPVVIEDDCWLGHNVFVKRGIYIGKGSVVGANCVVTRDIAPYSIHGGIPNRLIGTRLDFAPPDRIEAAKEEHWPYFYSGFRLHQSERQPAGAGALRTEREFRVVLRGGRFASVHLSGVLPAAATRCDVSCNGVSIGSLRIDEPAFQKTLAVDPRAWDAVDPGRLPEVMRPHNVLSFTTAAIDRERPSPPPGDAEEGIGVTAVAIA